jgi:hypothetical protein
MHDGWLGLCGMKDCFMGLRVSGGGFIGGGWLTNCSAIVSSWTSNSFSSSLMLSLGFCWMVRSIFLYRLEGWLDSWIKALAWCGRNSAVTIASVLLFGWSLELHSIALGLRSISLTGTILLQNWNNTEKQKTIFFFNEIKWKQNKTKLKIKYKK